MSQNVHKIVTAAERLALLERLQAGGGMYVGPKVTGPRPSPIMKKGDASPEGKAAKRRRKQMERQAAKGADETVMAVMTGEISLEDSNGPT